MIYQNSYSDMFSLLALKTSVFLILRYLDRELYHSKKTKYA